MKYFFLHGDNVINHDVTNTVGTFDFQFVTSIQTIEYYLW